jgi:hypothetical protein
MTPERQRELGRWRNPPAFFMPPPTKSPIHCQPPVLHPVCAAAHSQNAPGYFRSIYLKISVKNCVIASEERLSAFSL